MVSFSQLPAVKKDTIFGAARTFFGPSYFMTALVCAYIFMHAHGVMWKCVCDCKRKFVCQSVDVQNQ